MNGFAGFLSRSLRGFRLIEFGALLVLLTMVLGVYLAKAAAGRERGDITSVQAQIDEEGKRLRLLQAEVAHLEEPQRLTRLSAQLGLGPTNVKRQGSVEDLAEVARAALTPEKADKKLVSAVATTATASAAPNTGAPQ